MGDRVSVGIIYEDEESENDTDFLYNGIYIHWRNLPMEVHLADQIYYFGIERFEYMLNKYKGGCSRLFEIANFKDDLKEKFSKDLFAIDPADGGRNIYEIGELDEDYAVTPNMKIEHYKFGKLIESFEIDKVRTPPKKIFDEIFK